MRRIRLFALVVAVSATILPAASARAGDPFTLYGSGWGHGLGLSLAADILTRPDAILRTTEA